MIRIENLHINFPGFCIKDLNLNVKKGDFFILLGPTGSGKTVILETIAGLIPPNRGKIWIGDKDVTSLPPEKRDISIVYQDFALFPHLTVLKNIKYGLHYHNIDKTKSEIFFNWLINQLGLKPLLNRMPIKLSGGEKQRVALARALMIEPSVLLLDEPLSALDPRFREEIQNQLKKIHQETGTTILIVTHDFEEALALGSYGAVLDNGKIEQVGEIQEIFENPKSLHVASFTGMNNIFPASFKGTKAFIGNFEIELPDEVENGKEYIAIRPEKILISKKKFSSGMRNNLKGVIDRISNKNFYHEIHIKAGDVLFKSLLTKSNLSELGLKEKESIYFSFNKGDVKTF